MKRTDLIAAELTYHDSCRKKLIKNSQEKLDLSRGAPDIGEFNKFLNI